MPIAESASTYSSLEHLATLANAVRNAELGSPALLVIGRVVGLAQRAGHAGLERRRIA